jgi:hypothetical protein
MEGGLPLGAQDPARQIDKFIFVKILLGIAHEGVRML